MLRFQAGDVRAFEELVRRHRTPIFSFLLRLTGDRGRAEDLCQETFLRAVRAAERWEPRALFRTWLYAVARNQAFDEARRQAFRRTEPLDDPARAAQPSEDPGPDRAAEAALLRPKLEAALAALPDGAARGVPAAGARRPEVPRDRGGDRRPREHREEPDALRPRGAPRERSRRSGSGPAPTTPREEREPMTHEELRDRLLDLAFGELSPRDARKVEEHVGACEACRAELARHRGEPAGSCRRSREEPAPAGGERILVAAAREAARAPRAAPRPAAVDLRRLARRGLARRGRRGLLPGDEPRAPARPDGRIRTRSSATRRTRARRRPAPVRARRAASATRSEAPRSARRRRRGRRLPARCASARRRSREEGRRAVEGETGPRRRPRRGALRDRSAGVLRARGAAADAAARAAAARAARGAARPRPRPRPRPPRLPEAPSPASRRSAPRRRLPLPRGARRRPRPRRPPPGARRPGRPTRRRQRSRATSRCAGRAGSAPRSAPSRRATSSSCAGSSAHPDGAVVRYAWEAMLGGRRVRYEVVYAEDGGARATRGSWTRRRARSSASASRPRRPASSISTPRPAARGLRGSVPRRGSRCRAATPSAALILTLASAARGAEHWEAGAPRPFVAGRLEAGLHARALGQAGWGRPHWGWAGVQGAAFVTPNTRGAEAAVRGALPFLDLAVAVRRTRSFDRPLLAPSAAHDEGELSGGGARLTVLDADLSGFLPAPAGLVAWQLEWVRPLDLPAARTRSRRSGRWRSTAAARPRSAGLARRAAPGRVRVGPFGEAVRLLGRGRHGVARRRRGPRQARAAPHVPRARARAPRRTGSVRGLDGDVRYGRAALRLRDRRPRPGFP